MKIIPYSVNTGEKNMKIDSDLLDNAIVTNLKEPIFRLYGWKPACISLGKNQSDKFIDYNVLNKYNIDIGESVIESYKEISQILIDIFNKLGITLTLGGESSIHTKFDYCMLISTGADLCYRGKKFIGSAQCRKQGYILQHGSILLDYNKELLEELFKEEVSTDSIISLKEINPDITLQDIIDVVRK